MKINTTRFGEIEVSDESLFTLTSPILGYDEEKEFVLIEHKDKSNFRWLQSAKTPDLAFVVTIAGLFGIDYTFELPESTQDELCIEKVEDIITFNIVMIPHENPRASSINLLAPLIFNVNNKKGAQIILSGTDYSVNHPLCNDTKEEAKC